MHNAVMLLIDPLSGQIKDANPAAERFYGYTGKQLRSMTIEEINIGTPEEVKEERQRALTSEKSYFSFSHRLANGEIRAVEVHSSPITVEGSQSLFSIIHDVTERKRAEEQLQKLSLAVEQSPASIVITDTNGNIEYVNPKFTEVSGYTMEEVRGRKPSLLKSGETSQDEYKRLWETISAGQNWQGEFHNRKKNGELFWETASISPVKNKDNVVTNFVAVKEDITDRKLSEEALRHAQKLESIGTLAGGIAHDFNNLLNVIMGQSSLAIGRLPKESPAGNNITKALKAAERATDLTRQLLAYSGKGKFVTEDFNLNRLVEENAQLLELSLPKTTELRYELEGSSLIIHGDVGQVQQIIMNLIINAGEAMGPNPGHITIRTTHVELAESDTEYWKYTNHPLPPGEYASLQVSDTGQGMRPEILARIFDPFFTTKFTGRGLGLAAVLGIIRGHHGGVRIKSNRGIGTLFEIVFPIVDSPSTAELQGMKSRSVIDGRGRTILVIDDEPSILELLNDVFTEARFVVLTAMNPHEGIELYRQHQPDVSIVILDYSMPGMDGRVAFSELRKINPSVKVLLCSGYMEEEMKSAFGEMRPNDFIKKPYKPIDLLEKVASIIPPAVS
jgi:two-component system, cell cycle sensor histidine kinase and response regulator CckA